MTSPTAATSRPALRDPLLGFALLMAALWVLMPALLNGGQPGDHFEQFTWAHSMEGGYYKHPPLPTWLLAITRFKALSALRKKKDAELDDETAAAIEDTSDTPEVAVAKKDTGNVLRNCLARLSQDHREIVDLVYYHEKSVEEVAEIVGIPENTVKTRLFYARKKLAELLSAAGVERGWP